MKVNKISSKLIKPHSPTPQNLKNYYISFVDQCVGPMNLAVVLFYESKPENRSELEESLADILVQFYPLAGRYLKNDLMVDCSDQGAEFIEAEAQNDVVLMDVTAKQLNDLLPDQYFRIDEASDDPLLAIQATHFPSGGLTIAISVSHRVFDASSLGTFIAAWSTATATATATTPYHKIQVEFHIPSLLPLKKDHGFRVDSSEKSSTSNDHNHDHYHDHKNIFVKRLIFNKEAITRLKLKIKPNVGNGVLACAVIAKALILVDGENHGKHRDFIIFEPVNMRGRTTPPQPKHACGNFAVAAITRRVVASEAEGIGMEELVGIIYDAVEKSIVDHAEIVSRDRDGRDMIMNSLGNLKNEMLYPDTNVIVFSDWSEFGFYEADFGFGKPVVAGVGPHRPFSNSTVLMRSKEGDEIEAWVNLSQNDMRCFEQDEEIKLFMT